MDNAILQLDKIIVSRQNESSNSATPPSTLEYGEVAADIDGNLYVGDKTKKVKKIEAGEQLAKQVYDPKNHGIEITIQPYTHIKSGTTHQLTGSGNHIFFIATSGFKNGDTFQINGQTVSAKTISGDALWDDYFVTGAAIFCNRTGDTLNFNNGGLSSAETTKLTPENLKSGVTIMVSGNPVVGTFTSDGNITSDDIREGGIAYSNGQKVVGTMPTAPGNQIVNAVVLPTEGLVEVPPAYYSPGSSLSFVGYDFLKNAGVTEDNLAAGNYAMGIQGRFTEDATATAVDIAEGKTAYVNGQKVVGSNPGGIKLDARVGVFCAKKTTTYQNTQFLLADPSIMNYQPFDDMIYATVGGQYTCYISATTEDSTQINISANYSTVWSSPTLTPHEFHFFETKVDIPEWGSLQISTTDAANIQFTVIILPSN